MSRQPPDSRPIPVMLSPALYGAWMNPSAPRPTAAPPGIRRTVPLNTPLNAYAQETARIWSEIEALAARLEGRPDPEPQRRDELEHLVAEIRSHLARGMDCIDWQLLATTPVLEALHHQLTIPCAMKRAERIATIRPRLDARLLYRQQHDAQATYPWAYRCLALGEKGVRSGCYSAVQRYANCEGLGDALAIGLFTRQGQPIAFMPVDGEPSISVLECGIFDLPRVPVTPFFANYRQAEAALCRRLNACLKRPVPALTTIDLEGAKARWDPVVMAPETREEILRAWLLVAYRHKAAPRGILLKGPPGTGKTLLAQTFAETSGARFFKLAVSDLKGEFIGQSGKEVTRVWAQARKQQPAIIFIDECEGIFARRGSDAGDGFTTELVQNFLTEWDGIRGEHRILVIGATNRGDLLDDAIVSRFTDVIELLPVNAKCRPALIASVARQAGVSGPIDSAIVEAMGGLSGRDLRTVMQRAIREAAPDEPGRHHFLAAVGKVRNKSSTLVSDQATWSTLILPREIRSELVTLCHMLKDAEALLAKGIPMSRGLLLFGPPGTGKTQIARTLANEGGVAFISKTTADFKGQHLGAAARRIKETFETGRANSPCILFIDEIDSLAPSRESADKLQEEILTQLLQEMDGVADSSGFVLVVGATNRMDQLDPAILSRFARRVGIGLPNEQARAAILRTLLQGRPVSPDVNVMDLARQLGGRSGRDLRELVTEAFSRAVARAIRQGRPASAALLQASDIVPTLT